MPPEPGLGLLRRCLYLLPFALFGLLVARSCSALSCETLAEEAIKQFQPRFPLELRARAKAGADTGGLEPSSGAWVILEVPLWSKREKMNAARLQLRRKKEVLTAIAAYQAALARLRLIDELKSYRRRRAEAGFEDWENFLALLEQEERARARLLDAAAVLRAYAVPLQAAQTCFLDPSVSPTSVWPVFSRPPHPPKPGEEK